MSAMKPDEWRYTVNNVHTFYAGEKPPDDAYDEGTLVPMFTLATVRKWLEEVTEEMLADAKLREQKLNATEALWSEYYWSEMWSAMLAAKLREIENDT